MFTPLNLKSKPTPSFEPLFPQESTFPSVSDTINQHNISQNSTSTYGKISDALGNFSEGVVKGVGSTVTSLGQLAGKGLKHLPGQVGEFFAGAEGEGQHQKETTFKPEGTAQKIGFGAEQLGEFFIPAGEIAKVEKALTTGTNIFTKLAPHIGETAARLVEHAAKTGVKMGVRAGEGGGIIALQTGGDAEATKNAAETGAIFTGIGSGLVSPALKKLLAPFKGSADAATAKLFESEGIKAPVSALSKNEGVRLLEATGSKTLFGKKIAQTAQQAVDDIENKTNQAIEKISPKKGMSDQDLGKMLKQGLNEFETHFKDTEEKVYKEFSQKYGMAPSRPINTREELGNILAQQGEDMFKGKNPRLVAMFEKMSEESPEVKNVIKLMKEQNLPEQTIVKEVAKIREGQAPFEMSFNELKNTRTSVGEELARDPENTALKRLYGALSKDMQETVNFDPEGAVALSKLNAKYAAGKDKIEGRIAQSMIQSNPENIAHSLLQRNSADAINSLKEMVGPERFKEVSKHFVSNIVDAGKTEGGKFKISKLKNALNEYDQQTLDAILSPEEQKGLKEGISHLEKLEAMGQATKAGAKAAQGSQTAFLVNSGASATALATGITTALMTGNYAVLGGLAAKTGGEYALAKFIASDVGRKILTDGINPDNIKLLQKLKPALRSIIIETVGRSNNND